jgi:sigma-E factor negative regulatory protein RseC
LATEQGIVIKISSMGAIVKTLRSEACESCSAQHSCSTQGNEMEVEAVNRVGAKAGDRVVLEIKTSPFLKATFLLYVFPILCMMLGAVLGEKVAPKIGMGGNALSVLLAFAFFFFSIWVVKAKGEKMGKKEAYHPAIIRIIKLR